jgi:F420-dependent oxidoreductase-like protein
VGQQNMSMDSMRALWRRLDEAGLDWISAWDHFYEAPPAGGTLDHFEAVATLGALAAETRQARLGCLVFYVGYRLPTVLAKIASTLDHISGGRFELGIGAGWHEWEANAYGYDFPDVRTRLDMLEEAAPLIRSMLTEERTTFEGRFFRADDASCLPLPIQERLPIWIGGVGEKRTLRTVARHADGWNAAYISPEEFGRLNEVLDQRCEEEDRDPTEIRRSVNLMFMLAADEAGAKRVEDQLQQQWGGAAGRVMGGALTGTPDRAAERLAEYVAAGAQGINVALRAPWDVEALDAYVDDVVPSARKQLS